MNKKTRIPKPVSHSTTLNTGSKVVNPLAKAMEKKSKSDKVSQPESWYDEKIESVSQKQEQHTKTEHEKRKEELYSQLKKTEEELVAMQDLLDEREKIIQDAQEEKENESNGEGLEEDTDAGTEEQSEKVEKITKKSMKSMRDRMQDMRDKLQKMNKETDHYLADIENTMQYLDSLEVASGRLGPLSDETRRLFGDVDDEEIIAQISKENKNPDNDMKAKTHPSKEVTSQHLGDSDVEGDSDSKGDEHPGDDSTQDDQKGSKFFVTERTVTSHHIEDKDKEEVNESGDDTGDESH